MSFASLPVILYVLPLFFLFTAISHPFWKQDALAVGGLAVVYMTGGYPALILLGLSVSLTWLILRLSPRKADGHLHRAELWLYVGVGLQALILLLGRILLGNQPLLPLFICALQGVECMSEHANNRLKIPPLHAFFCYQCDMTRLPAGPVLSFPDYEKMVAERSVSAEKVGRGASMCIRGLFQLVCLSLPMQALHAQLASGGTIRSALDAGVMMLVFYMMLYYRLKGTARIGQGIAAMLGYDIEDSFQDPVLASSLHEFWERFLVPMHQWTKRVLLPDQTEKDPAGYFARTALLFGGIGLLFGSSGCGMIWGVGTALCLTAEHRLEQKTKLKQLPVTARRLLTVAVVLLGMGMMGSRTLFDSFGCYGALLCINGIPLTDRTGYLLGTNWVAFLIAFAGLFPLKRLLPEQKNWSRGVRKVFAPAAELAMLLFSFTELLSRYLRP